MKFCGCAGPCAVNPRPTAPATEAIMPERFPGSLQQKIEDRLRYYEDLGIRLFYTDRGSGGASLAVSEAVASVASPISVFEEIALPKPTPQPDTRARESGSRSGASSIGCAARRALAIRSGGQGERRHAAEDSRRPGRMHSLQAAQRAE